MAPLRIARAVHAVAVKLSRFDVRQVAVEDHFGAFRQIDRRARRRRFGAVEQAQLGTRAVLAEERELDATAIPGRPQRIGTTRPHTHRRHTTTPGRTHRSSSAPERTRRVVCRRPEPHTSPPSHPIEPVGNVPMRPVTRLTTVNFRASSRLAFAAKEWRRAAPGRGVDASSKNASIHAVRVSGAFPRFSGVARSVHQGVARSSRCQMRT